MLPFLRKHFRLIAGGFALTFFSSFGQTFFVAGSASEWMRKFGLSAGEFGRLYMAATLASALTLPFIGRTIDVWPERRVAAATICVLALACVLAVSAPSVIVLAAAIYLLRLFGQGMMGHIAFTVIGRRFDRQRGRAISLVTLGHQGGEATLPLIYAAFALSVGWQWAWAAGAAVLVAVALPLAFVTMGPSQNPEAETTDSEDPAAQWTRGQVLRDPVFWVLLTGVLAPPFIGTTIFFHQDYLTELRGWPAALFASGFTAMAITTVLFALASGALIDRFGAKVVLPFFLLPLAGSCFCAGLLSAPLSLFLFMVLMGISYGFSSTLFGSLWPEVYGTEHLGAVRSVIIPFLVLATAAGPGLTGTLIDQGFDLPAQLIVMGGYCLVAAVLMTAASWRLQKRLSPKLVVTDTLQSRS